jgi:coenzyme F420-reducing hydrogenase beta subunit
LKKPEVYAAQLYDDTILKSSTSGAFFAALAMKVLENGGNVYGVKFDNNIASFSSADTFEKLNQIRGSKYISSDTGNVFKKVKADLEKNRVVLFSGCPCQVAGLRAFLKKDYENLLTVDIVCHGTPSSKLFSVYLRGMEKIKRSKISDFVFRDKSKYGWGVYWSYVIKGKKITGGLHDDPYISAFIDGFANRECCYDCHYVGVENRAGDVTLGDYWGVDIEHPSMASNNGVSAVIVNTKKGSIWCERALKLCKYENSNVASVAKHNPSLIKSIRRPEKRDAVYEGIDCKSPEDFVRENLGIETKRILKTKLRLLMPYYLRVKIKETKRKISMRRKKT